MSTTRCALAVIFVQLDIYVLFKKSNLDLFLVRKIMLLNLKEF
jgi:hypothetical protein